MFNELQRLARLGYTVQFGKHATDDDYWAQVFKWDRELECDHCGGQTNNNWTDACHAKTLTGALRLAISEAEL
jgi:hypothetical protein